MKFKLLIVLLIHISSTICSLKAQNNIEIDTVSINSFLEWKFDEIYFGRGLICMKALSVDDEIFDCLPIKKQVKKNIKPLPPMLNFKKGLVCDYLNPYDIYHMKIQNSLVSNLNLDSFRKLKNKYRIIKCDTSSSENVINEYSIPLFSRDKNTVLLINTDGINNTACETYRICLYKKDDQNNWHFFKELFSMDSD